MLMYDAFGSIKFWHMEFLTIITPNLFDHSVKLSLNHSDKRSQESSSIRLGSHKVNPGGSSTIINQGKKVTIPFNSGYL